MNSMNYIGKFISNFKHFYNEINAATLTGAIDVVVVEQPDGSFTCSPFHVRFGKMGVLRSREKVVDIEINGEAVDIHMKLGDSGEAFFVEGVAEGDEADFPPHLACSPIPIEGYHMHQHLGGGRSEFEGDAAEEEKQETMEDVTPLEETPAWAEDDVKEEKGVIDEGRESISSLPVAQTFSPGVVEGVVLAPEFRPIIGEGESEVSDAKTAEEVEGSSAKVTEEETSAPAAVPIVGNSGGKRKRRRKSTMKKKAAMAAAQAMQQQNDTRSGWTKEQEEAVREREQATASPDGMFPMDDVDGVQEPAPTPQTPPEKSPSAEVTRRPADFHFFSDTEATPGCSRPNSRAGSPIRSDTEFEVQLRHNISTQTERDGELSGVERAVMGATKEQRPSWKWGELPSPLPPACLSISGASSGGAVDGGEAGGAVAGQVGPKGISSDEDELEMAAVSKKEQEEAQRSMLGGMFSFMKRSKRMRRHRRNGAEEDAVGVYLDDLDVDRLDPEVAALYFPASFHRTPAEGGAADESRLGREEDEEEDAESGNGPSLPQSPHSVEGAIGGPKSSLDSDFEDLKNSAFDNKHCGDLSMSLCGGLSEFDCPNEETFARGQVSYDDLVSNPKLLEDPALVVRMGGKFYPWRAACPIIISLLIFQKPLPATMVDALLREYIPNKKQPKVPEGRGYSSWFSWGRSESKKVDGKVVIQETATLITEGSVSDIKVMANGSAVPEPSPENAQSEKSESLDWTGVETGIATQTSFPGSLIDITKEMKGENYSGSNSSDDSDGGRQVIHESHSIRITTEKRRSIHDTVEKYRKTLRLSSEQIESLKLKEGANEVMFSVTTAYQGTTRCKCHIYRWRYDDKIVVSDIDGTITKSDVLGHILPIVGKDWAQSGVAQLFTKIKNNGYRLLYLSARAIGQARITREYLKSIKQGDISLPEGPLLLNPTSLISALHREVIEKKPEEFKISCLKDIQALFPSSHKPFYAGYGNKINDVWAYRAVGIPIVRIFTINHKGELKHELTQTFQSSYSNMSYIVDQMFPPLPEDNSSSEDFTNFMYWRDPIPEIVAPLPDLKLISPEVTTKTATIKEEKISVQ